MIRGKENIPQYATDVMLALSRAGYRGYLVGGCVRDLLRGVTPHDFDMTTDATPEEMTVALADFRLIPTGIKHGTVTVMSGGEPIELTTHRADGEYRDSRHPESVCFSRRLSDDLSRRDFTVNAMAWSPDTGLVDLFGGREDLAAGVLRAVGEPHRRFEEDALRILRAFRFSAQLDFAIEPQTLSAAREMRSGLCRISAERISSEICRLLAAPAAARGLSALFGACCGDAVFGEVRCDDTALSFMESLPPEAPIRLAALLRRETPAAAHALCRRWHTSNAFAEKTAAILAAAAEPLPQSAFEARRFAVTHWGAWRDALLLRVAAGEEVGDATALLSAVVRDKTAVAIHGLAVNGKELQQRVGVRPADTAKLLARLQECVWREPQDNKKARLLLLAEKIVKEGSL